MDTPLLLAELHAHSDWSDGALSLAALVDLYGEHGFDVLCVTDHTLRTDEGNRSFVGMHNWRDYLDAVDAEAARAIAQYGMLVVPGLELTDDHDDRRRSAHALAVGLRRFVSIDAGLRYAITEARGAGAAIIAAHPHAPGENRRGTCRWWYERREPTIVADRYELFNRNDVFAWVADAELPAVASGDFHRPEHLSTWKTLLPCAPDEHAVVGCLRSSARLYLAPFPLALRPLAPAAARELTAA
jgi:hypothetical protein